MKIVSIIKTFGFVVTVLTSIPLFVAYLMQYETKSALISHLHVWSGVVFIAFAITNMVMDKKAAKQKT